MDAVTYPTLEHVAQQARPYPTRILEGQDTGLILFAAGVPRPQRRHPLRQADMTCTCVDLDGDRLMEMARLYPPTWDFLADDAWEFCRASDEAMGRRLRRHVHR